MTDHFFCYEAEECGILVYNEFQDFYGYSTIDMALHDFEEEIELDNRKMYRRYISKY